MVILASRPVGGYLGGKTAQGLDYLEQDVLMIIETDLKFVTTAATAGRVKFLRAV